jgi:5-(aminomethyl)-3-furanmethanol phosphate kinase
MPTRMVLDAPEIPASWDITSDSLAAWLASRLAADRLVLVKSVALAEVAIPATVLVRRGLVDPAFPGYAAVGACEAWCIDDVRFADMARALRAGSGPGTRILPATARRASIAGRRRRANISVEPRGRVQSR